MLPPSALFGFHIGMRSSGTPIAFAVLRPRCWSGKNSTRCPRSNAHSSTVAAFDDVQTMPPCSPQNPLSAADEFMYVTGMTGTRPSASGSVPYSSSSCSQHSRTESMSAMSAIEQPAARFGRMTLCPGCARMSAVSAMKCTPQNTIASAFGTVWAAFASWNESPRKSACCTTSSRW